MVCLNVVKDEKLNRFTIQVDYGKCEETVHMKATKTGCWEDTSANAALVRSVLPRARLGWVHLHEQRTSTSLSPAGPVHVTFHHHAQ